MAETTPANALVPARQRIQLGCIADDFTGATDLANNLVRAGMRTVQTIGVPSGPLHTQGGALPDAVVVALKSRTSPPEDAVAQSLQALRWLQAQGAQQFYFKYCSTFDSTPRGNIGPVAEALMDALGTDFTIATPAFPDNGRTVFKGHLFVGDGLLSDSGMRDHPLTPMADSNLVRVLQAQCRRPVGLIDYRCVAAGADAVRARIAELRAQGVGLAVVDALSNEDLLRMGPALADLSLLTAGSGVAIALPANFRHRPGDEAQALPEVQGACAVLAGSCSQATNRQVAHFLAQGGWALRLDPVQGAQDPLSIDAAIETTAARLGAQPVLVYSTAQPESLRQSQERLGVAAAGEWVERALARVAQGLVTRGVRRLVVAGGETSGAVVQALGVKQLQIGPQIDPGVPWCHAPSDLAPEGGLRLALKSGNFGTDDFFTKAFASPHRPA